jgi:predicted RNase H-like nuclease (RuvC/YqgF family)
LGSPFVPPDRERLAALERIAEAVAEEIAGWRKRCLEAEAEVEALKARTASFVSGDIAQGRQRNADLEGENRELRRRIAAAREQVEQLRTRLRFVAGEAAGTGT